MQRAEGQRAGWGQSGQLNDLNTGGGQDKQDLIAEELGGACWAGQAQQKHVRKLSREEGGGTLGLME